MPSCCFDFHNLPSAIYVRRAKKRRRGPAGVSGRAASYIRQSRVCNTRSGISFCGQLLKAAFALFLHRIQNSVEDDVRSLALRHLSVFGLLAVRCDDGDDVRVDVKPGTGR